MVSSCESTLKFKEVKDDFLGELERTTHAEVCYNGGRRVTLTGREAVEDLMKELEPQDIVIMSGGPGVYDIGLYNGRKFYGMHVRILRQEDTQTPGKRFQL